MRVIIFLLICLLLASCTNRQEAPDGTPSNQGEPGSSDLAALIAQGKVQITRDGSLEVISVLGPNQYQTTGLVDCWIHAPFNVWRLLEGDSIESFASEKWRDELTQRVVEYKRQVGIEGSRKAQGSHECPNVLNDLRKNPDFSEVSVIFESLNFWDTNRKVKAHTDLVPFIDYKYLNKNEWQYFSSPKGKQEIQEYSRYLEECDEALFVTYRTDKEKPRKIPFKESFYHRCKESLIKKGDPDGDGIRSVVDKYLSGKSAEFIESIITQTTYRDILAGLGSQIRRLRDGHDHVIYLSFKNEKEYYLAHAVAVRIAKPDAHKIIIVNSEPRHIGAIKSIKALHTIFSLPLPEELK